MNSLTADLKFSHIFNYLLSEAFRRNNLHPQTKRWN